MLTEALYVIKYVYGKPTLSEGKGFDIPEKK